MVWGLNPGRARSFFLFNKMSRPALGISQSPVQEVLGFFPGDKAVGTCKVNHSPPFSAEVKDKCSYTFALPICVHGMDRETLTFSLTAVNISLFIIITQSQY
jgi:hypothetical protein